MVKKLKKWLLRCAICGTLGFLALVIIAAGEEQRALEEAVVGIAAPVTVSAAEQQAEADRIAGKATFVGVDDTDTDLSRRVLARLWRWSNAYTPYDHGYGGLCEAWVCDVYEEAGLYCQRSCCAYRHSQRTAHREGAIPKGAFVFSGTRPDGSIYENGHRASAYCHYCDHWAGHVAIYIGNGVVAGSQIPYLFSLDSWIQVYGYGGWATE